MKTDMKSIMKKILTFIMTIMIIAIFTACGDNKNANNNKDNKQSTSEKKDITIKSLDGTGKEIELKVPYNPKRIAILDLASLDILDCLGLGDRVVGCADTSIEYLKKYTERKGVKSIGTIKEADLESVMECEPDVIFIGGRLSGSYDALSEIAPVIYLSMDTEIGVVKSTKKNAETIASIFGKEDEIEDKFAGFEGRIKKLQEVAKGKTAVIGMSTSGSFNVVGNAGRCSLIGNEVGFDNLNKDVVEKRGSDKKNSNKESNKENTKESNNSAHGNEASFELVVSQKPDYIFVLDRDSAIGTEGAKLAKEIMENELIKSTAAYKNGNLIIMENPGVWYTAEGGVTALDIMIGDLEKELK